MATTIQLKKSTTGGTTPSSLAQGEFAINLVDKRIFSANATAVFDAFQNTVSNVSITTSTSTNGFRAGNSTVNASVLPALISTTGNVSANIITTGNSTVNTTSNSTAFFVSNTVGTFPVYPNIPLNAQSASYTFTMADAQKLILHPNTDNNARTFTVPNNSSVAYPVGTVISVANRANVVSLAITTDTMIYAGNGATGTRTLANNGFATITKIEATVWFVSGVGIS